MARKREIGMEHLERQYKNSKTFPFDFGVEAKKYSVNN